MALGVSMGQDLITALDGIAGYSHQTASYHPPLSSSTSRHCAHIFLLLFLSHFSITYLLISGVYCSWVSGVISGVLCSTSIVWYQVEVIVGMVCPPRPVWH